MAELLEISGTVEHIVFHNEKNQYSVIQVVTETEEVTVVGTLPYITAGEDIKVIGEWAFHQSFGQQFKAISVERIRPQTTSAILKYLSSGAIKGIGKATALRIVDAFGENTLDVIENEPLRLKQIKGITEEKAKAMSEEVKRIYGVRELMITLANFGIKPEEAVKAWRVYGNESIALIKENPYCLCNELIGVSFAVADQIAMNMEKPLDDFGRVCAGIIYILRHNANNGHSCIPINKLILTSSRMLKVAEHIAEETVISLCQNCDLICVNFSEIDYVFLPKLYESECHIAERINLMLKYPAPPIGNLDEEIEKVEERNNIEYASLQKNAIKLALEKGMIILTGGPGTGKTTTLNGIISILKKRGDKVFLAAPTGKAAKRMSELTGEEAKTIHRMLQVDWDSQDKPIFVKNESNPLNCEAIIVDEVSMVDISVMEGLLLALPLGCRLILVGDTDQLPSVGAGNVLGDLISSGKIPTVKLTEIFRQARESLIVMNAHSIVCGENPDLSKVDKDFFFMARNNEEDVIKTVSDLICERLPNRYGYSPCDDIQILCPSRKGLVGTENLNKVLKERINPESNKKKQAEIMNNTFREGDKVMHIKNNYDLTWEKVDGTFGEGVFNGDMGTVLNIDKFSGNVRVKIDDKIANYDFEQVGKELEHAYAVTVHKSQGNEYPAVIIPLFKGTDKLKYRNLLYTAITRAKEILIIVGERQVIYDMIRNDKKTLRYTGLSHILLEN